MPSGNQRNVPIYKNLTYLVLEILFSLDNFLAQK